MEKGGYVGVSLKFQDRLAAGLHSALDDRGFAKADEGRIKRVLCVRNNRGWKGQPLTYDNESIYILNRDNGKPNFSVFITKNAHRDSVTVLASNPREDEQGSHLPRAYQYYKRTFSSKSGDPLKTAHTIAEDLTALASLKKTHRMQVHFHSGRMLDGSSPHDDGVSDIASSIRRALLHNVDVLVYTPHNAFEMHNNKHMASILSEFGMIAPIAGEITMPLKDDHPSGPHHILMAADPKIAFGMVGGILVPRDRSLKMPSYFTGMTIDQMYEKLEPMRKSNDIVVGLAHPVNFNSTTLPISGVGLFSSVQQGHISYEQAMDYASRNDFVESWNDSLYMGEMEFGSPDFRAKMLQLLAEHGAKLGIPEEIKLSTNLCNLLVAAELGAKFGLGHSFGTDAHTEAPLERDYAVGGDWFSRGWTTLDIPEAMQDHKISSEELVRGISKKEIKMGTVLFSEISDDLVRIVNSRTKRPTDNEAIIEKQDHKVTARYAAELAKDFANFLLHGRFMDISRMSE